MVLDRKIALALMGIFTLFYVASYQYPPDIVAFPRFLSYALLVLSILLFIFPKDIPNYNLRCIISKEKIIATLTLISYVIIFPFIGFFTTTFLFTVLYMWYFNRKGLKKYIVIATIYITIIYFVFQKFLYVWFPEGLIM